MPRQARPSRIKYYVMDCADKLTDTDETKKILDAMLDSVTSKLISLLEDGSKTVTELCSSSDLAADDIHNRFAPLVKHGLIVRTDGKDDTTYSVNADKLDSALSKSNHFDGAIGMVSQMDTFLN